MTGGFNTYKKMARCTREEDAKKKKEKKLMEKVWIGGRKGFRPLGDVVSIRSFLWGKRAND